MNIRKANSQDAQDIAKVHVDSWRTTYKGILPDDFLNNLSYEQRTELWKKNISDATNYVLVAENEQNEIIGFATGATRKTNSVPNATDLTSIYLLEEYQGIGIGKQLLTEIFAYFKLKGYEKVFVEVLAENKTRNFYEYYGAQYVDNTEIKIGGKVLEELIYVWNDIDKVIEKIK
ncbi:GNAT family N-acetyltransferase [Lysinibacillus xylanilyticus]|uniref:GNAT family N-acetyltransferase n=1 Tax=Lysinibacillus xylanilyticus TaxID=582475 RepID=A0ABT4EUH8_9BACI|nr:GNAT family N-acetyltransferase [Lysinibacillus xylanilyticus]MCY9547834.1 GNAT family N-acetyltransferase [Lysinibacillus xylanilyticus]